MINSRQAIPTSSSDALLTYTLLTEPDPLQINSAGILTLVVSKSARWAHETHHLHPNHGDAARRQKRADAHH
jgi:hypothetical protein